MSKQSEKVKKWRKSCKQRIIEAMGDKCCICSYNRCHRSLDLHHLDPSKKDISLGAVRANPKNWNKIVVELRKCVLLCSNCHGEVHDGLVEVPANAPAFNENFANYKEFYKSFKNIMDKCPICGNDKQNFNFTCSYVCAAKRRRKIDWDSIDLENELKNKSVVRLAEELGCSDAAIHKRLKKLGLK